MATPLPPVRSGPTYYDYYTRELLITHKKYNNLEEDLEEELQDDAEDPQDDQELEPEQDTITIPTADELVSASLRSGALLAVCEIEEARAVDDEEEKRVKEFVDRGCGCDNGPNKSQCSLLFPIEHYRSLRSTFAELNHDELDLIVMGHIMAHTFRSSLLQGHHSYVPAERRITYSQFFHQGHRVCQRTFLFIHTIGIKRFKGIKSSYLNTGPVPRVHGNRGRRPKHQLSLEQIKDVTQYVLNYTGK